MSEESNGFLLGCDVGGTFTDFVIINDYTGEFRVEKVLTTPDDPAVAIFEGFKNLDKLDSVTMAGVLTIVHGTTLVVNALIERKGSKTALLTTRGFRDVLEMRKELRYDVYDLQIEFPAPLVPRYLRKEVTERMSAGGLIIKPLDIVELEKILKEILHDGVASIAVSFLHSYANPEHEEMAGKYISAKVHGIEVSLSADVLPQINEYERTSTTVANAYVKPKVKAYLEQLDHGLKNNSFEGKLYVMQSSGGVIGVETAKEFPIRILESGPAGGVAAARWWATLCGIDDMLCFDMGGTTAKLCALSHGGTTTTSGYEAARMYRFKKGSGFAIGVPVLDLLEIGAGGGSIARIDRLGLVKVGPDSAGAKPGPVCYGTGGREPTVTDADLTLGYLDPHHFLGGTMPLYQEAAEQAILTTIAQKLEMKLAEAAYGIHDVVNENMAAAARLHMAERGVDPSDLPLFVYGGAGPVHAYGLARKIGNQMIIVPKAAGVLSALGLLVANISMDVAKTYKVQIRLLEIENLEITYRELEQTARTLLPQLETRGQIVFHRALQMHYAGQGYEVDVDLPGSETGSKNRSKVNAKTILDLFNTVYKRMYGRIYNDVPVEIINLRVVAEIIPDSKFSLPHLNKTGRDVQLAIKGSRNAFFPENGGYIQCPVYDRDKLEPDHSFAGPAIIEERESTTIVGSDAKVEVDAIGTLFIRI